MGSISSPLKEGSLDGEYDSTFDDGGVCPRFAFHSVALDKLDGGMRVFLPLLLIKQGRGGCVVEALMEEAIPNALRHPLLLSYRVRLLYALLTRYGGGSICVSPDISEANCPLL